MTSRRPLLVASLLGFALATASFAGQGNGSANGNGAGSGGGSCTDPSACTPEGTGPYGPPTGGTPSGGALGSGGPNGAPGQPAGGANGPSCSQQEKGALLLAYLETLPVATLTESEAAWILFVREEEKLARDLYLAFAADSTLPAFSKVAEAEQRHFDLTGWLIARYDLVDPAFGRLPGQFTNSTLQALYDELLAIGGESDLAALTAAGLVEETDLVDVGELDPATSADDLATVAQNLARGSRNHLRGFVQALANQAVTYEPVVLDAESYAEIIESETERGAVDVDGNTLPGTATCGGSAF